jgi:hypothetical protein
MSTPEIAFLNRSSLSEEDVAYHVRAINVQMERDFCPAWRGELFGGDEPWNCVAYAELPVGAAYAMVILNDIQEPNALGFHDDIGGTVYGRVLAQGALTPITGSHEATEMRADPEINLWRPMPGILQEVALEVADPVEADTYSIAVDLFGKSKNIPVSNFVLPSWFDINGSHPFDFLGLLREPFSMTQGGYMILRDKAGRISQVFARGSTAHQVGRSSSKLRDPMSRSFRRVIASRK